MMRFNRQFTLIELLVCLSIIGLLMTLALDQYFGYVHEARVSKCRSDIEKLAEAIRLYNTREQVLYDYRSFIPLIGTYLLEPPPKDPWAGDYILDPVVGIVYSKGPNGIDEKGDPLGDDLSRPFLPTEVLLKDARHLDANLNCLIDTGDSLILTFTRPIHTLEALKGTDFILSDSLSSLGSVEVQKIPARKSSRTLSIRFVPPKQPRLVTGNVSINLASGTFELICDLSVPPKHALAGPGKKILGFR